MQTVTYDTENASFTFRMGEIADQVSICLSEYKLEEVINILDYLARSEDPSITVPGENSYFGFVVLDLIALGKGSVHCKLCERSYEPDQLTLVLVGHGTSPLHPNIRQSGGIFKGIFRLKRTPNPPMFGGKAYECPQGHELISRVTWRT